MSALTSKYREGVTEIPIKSLYPWTYYGDDRWKVIADDIRQNGMMFPLLAVRITGRQWHRIPKIRSKPWKLPLLERDHQVPPDTDEEILAVRVGCQRFHAALDAGVESVSCIVFDTVDEALAARDRIHAEGRNDARQAEIDKYIYLYGGKREKKNGRMAWYGRMAPWRAELLKRYYGEAKGRGATSILDVGCGRADSVKIGRSLGLEATGAEVVPSLCEAEGVVLIPGAHKLPFKDKQFGALSCVDVMEHLLEHDVRACFREFARVAPESLIGISLRESAWRAHVLHITIKPAEWWLTHLRQVFSHVEMYDCDAQKGEYLVVRCE